MSLPEIVGNRFIYFGYGSNMLAKRIQIQNKSAVRKDYGKLKDYKLQFYSSSTKWKGAPATIIPKPGDHVMGAIWEIDLPNMKSLDEQESVPQGIYIPLSLPVENSKGETIMCRVYRLKNLPEELPKGSPIPFDRQPSHTYLKTIVKGAIETSLPKEYVDFIKSFKHNEVVVPELEEELELGSFKL